MAPGYLADMCVDMNVGSVGMLVVAIEAVGSSPGRHGDIPTRELGKWDGSGDDGACGPVTLTASTAESWTHIASA